MYCNSSIEGYALDFLLSVVASHLLCLQRYSISQLTAQQQSVIEDLAVLGLVMIQKVCLHMTLIV